MMRTRLVIAVVGGFALLIVSASLRQVWSVEPQAPLAPDAPQVKDDDRFTVPDTDDERALQLFLQRLVEAELVDPTPEVVLAHLQRIDQSVATLLQRKLSDSLYLKVASMRLNLLATLEDLEDPKATEKAAEFLKVLSSDPRPDIKLLAERYAVEDRVRRIADLSPAEQQKLADDINALIKAASTDDPDAIQFSIQMAMTAGELLQRAGSPLAGPVFASFVETIRARNDSNLADLVVSMEGTMRRLQLPGKPIEIAGETLDGKPFNISQLQGKVVLVEYWATWCGPCIAGLPHVKALYEAYHNKGFEIVGVSLDDDRGAVEEFVKAQGIQWPILFDAAAADPWSGANVLRYGINSIPTLILVDRDGKVVKATELIGPQLDAQLEKLLGPANLKLSQGDVPAP
jgi:thiol-disulfide isomerase/thioredoxin